MDYKCHFHFKHAGETFFWISQGFFSSDEFELPRWMSKGNISPWEHNIRSITQPDHKTEWAVFIVVLLLSSIVLNLSINHIEVWNTLFI